MQLGLRPGRQLTRASEYGSPLAKANETCTPKCRNYGGSWRELEGDGRQNGADSDSVVQLAAKENLELSEL